ncbi:MAG TPA: methyltransferase domain-containing protein [Terriglobales bacterium]|nr:methyltransferase domain-containing protein [Terriglobales bacterium]
MPVNQLETETSLAPPSSSSKDKRQLLRVLRNYVQRAGIQRSDSILVVGGGEDDIQMLTALGLTNFVISNLAESGADLDAENIALPDNSYDVVFAHAVLHHCRSPHKAVGEMLRVARKNVMFVEPNDSLFMRTLVRSGFSFPYEVAAVMANEYIRGGVRDTCIPNYLYRWNLPELQKTAASAMPEHRLFCYGSGYWDFYVNERELGYRKGTRIGKITNLIGARNFIRLLHFSQRMLNVFPPIRHQGNKFFGGIQKSPDLQPWLVREEDRVRFNRNWS